MMTQGINTDYQRRLPNETSNEYWERMSRYEKEHGITPEDLSKRMPAWPTPRAEDSESCGNHPGATDSLTGVIKMWATPDANPEAPNSGTNRGKDYGVARRRLTVQGLGNQAMLWQTPNSRDGDKWNNRAPGSGHNNNLSGHVAHWPTPSGSVAQDGGESVESWDARREILKQTANNGNGAGEPLTIASLRCLSSLPAPQTSTPGERSLESGQTSRRRLNPRFVSWLMNLPSPVWTSLAPINSAHSETPWSVCALRRRLSYLLDNSE